MKIELLVWKVILTCQSNFAYLKFSIIRKLDSWNFVSNLISHLLNIKDLLLIQRCISPDLAIVIFKLSFDVVDVGKSGCLFCVCDLNQWFKVFWAESNIYWEAFISWNLFFFAKKLMRKRRWKEFSWWVWHLKMNGILSFYYEITNSLPFNFKLFLFGIIEATNWRWGLSLIYIFK